ncbi:MAG: hypothetical protein R3F48_00185 [Candidatus Zixiibacteriota bacterium]
MKNKIHTVERRLNKMNETNVKGAKPDYKGRLEVSAWENTDKNGNLYLSVKISNRAILFPNKDERPTYEIEQKEIEDIF